MEEIKFDWDEGNTGHIAAHKVSQTEAEEVLVDDPLEMDFEITEEGEERWSYLGETARGRLLYIVITLRTEKVRVITAFDAPMRDKLFYLETKAGLHNGSEDTQIRE
jgi:uncharacterized DUF497 family protein